MCCLLAGISLIYFLCLVFAIYQKYEDAKEVMYWLYPDLRDWKPDEKVVSACCVLIVVPSHYFLVDVLFFSGEPCRTEFVQLQKLGRNLIKGCNGLTGKFTCQK